MAIDDIRRLIAPDEHRELELKKTTGELKDGMHSALRLSEYGRRVADLWHHA